MALSKSILGMNARNYLYLRRYNKRYSKLRADDKLATKRLLVAADIPTTKLIQVFRSPQSIREFDWGSLPESFVLKPARGYGGEGILVVNGWNGHVGVDVHEDPVSIFELESTMFDILDGAHSFNSLPDVAYIEEKVEVLSTLRKLGPGVPDVRVIVCNRVPVMAMLRVATHMSRGRANLHMGGVGIGIDIRTGITTRSILKSRQAAFLPGTKIKAHGIKIPQWEDVLEISARAQDVSGLGFAGIDIVHDERYGPLVLEINARPGLSIQLANGESLRTRLERVDELHVPSIKKGIALAKELFASPVLFNVDTENNVLNLIEKITIFGTNGKRKTLEAKVDTGAYRTSIDSSLVEELALPLHEKTFTVRSGTGEQEREAVDVTFKLRGKTIETVASFVDRGHMNYPVIIGRLDMTGFLVDPTIPKE
jgi:alpha-L-glutamate ligase-like protein